MEYLLYAIYVIVGICALIITTFAVSYFAFNYDMADKLENVHSCLEFRRLVRPGQVWMRYTINKTSRHYEPESLRILDIKRLQYRGRSRKWVLYSIVDGNRTTCYKQTMRTFLRGAYMYYPEPSKEDMKITLVVE